MYFISDLSIRNMIRKNIRRDAHSIHVLPKLSDGSHPSKKTVRMLIRLQMDPFLTGFLSKSIVIGKLLRYHNIEMMKNSCRRLVWKATATFLLN